MSPDNLKFDLVRQHNAEYPREIHAAKEVSRLLQKVNFPGKDIWVDLRFDYALTDHSTSHVDVRIIRGEPHGIVKLSFQGLYLTQDFETMLHEVIPHEIAHVLHGIKAKIDDRSIDKPHDDEWAGLFESLNENFADPSAKIKGMFDERPVRMSKSAILAMCECGDDESFEAYADTVAISAKLRKEEITCNTCKSPFVRVPPETPIPDSIRKDLEFLERIKCIKLQHTHLQR